MKRNFGFIYKGLVILLMNVSVCVIIPQLAYSAPPIIIDHTCTDIRQIPESAIEQAKMNLHIAYGHTSHGSQLTTGVTFQYLRHPWLQNPWHSDSPYFPC
jgi:hypothetical protein